MAKKATVKKATSKGKASAPTEPFTFDFSTKAIDKNLTVIKKSQAELDAVMHTTAQQVICQIMSFRNADIATRFFNTLGESVRKKALISYLEKHTPVKCVSKKAEGSKETTRSFKMSAAEDSDEWIAAKKRYDADPAAFINTPTFWDFEPENYDVKPFDLLASVERIIKQAESANVYPKKHPKAGQPLPVELQKKNKLQGLAELRSALAKVKTYSHDGNATVN